MKWRHYFWREKGPSRSWVGQYWFGLFHCSPKGTPSRRLTSFPLKGEYVGDLSILIRPWEEFGEEPAPKTPFVPWRCVQNYVTWRIITFKPRRGKSVTYQTVCEVNNEWCSSKKTKNGKKAKKKNGKKKNGKAACKAQVCLNMSFLYWVLVRFFAEQFSYRSMGMFVRPFLFVEIVTSFRSSWLCSSRILKRRKT